MSNKELLLKEFEIKVLSNLGNLDGFIKLPAGDDVEHMFFDPVSGKVLEISFRSNEMLHHHYYFDSRRMTSCIKQTKKDGRFICIDWTINELTILDNRMEQYGIKNYMIKELPYKPVDEYRDMFRLHELIFSDLADSSTFEVYFQHFFHDHRDEDDVKEILTKNKLLD